MIIVNRVTGLPPRTDTHRDPSEPLRLEPIEGSYYRIRCREPGIYLAMADWAARKEYALHAPHYAHHPFVGKSSDSENLLTQWEIKPVGNGFWSIANRATGGYLESGKRGGTTTDQRESLQRLWQSPPREGDLEQQWCFETITLSASAAEPRATPVEITNSLGMELRIPTGQFEIGATPEEAAWEAAEGIGTDTPAESAPEPLQKEARHRVTIFKPFYLGRYAVTQSEYGRVMGTNPSAFTEQQIDASAFQPALSKTEVSHRLQARQRVAGRDTGRYPVETVNWADAMEFCDRLSAMPAEKAARRVYRLPTEAEWEYACRAGTTTRWYSGNDEAGLADVAWFDKNSGGMTHPVGEKKPNAWGLYDMHGNVWQWCADACSKDYAAGSDPRDPAGPPAGIRRILRGGAWAFKATVCRSGSRAGSASNLRNGSYGFRVVCMMAEAPQSVRETEEMFFVGPWQVGRPDGPDFVIVLHEDHSATATTMASAGTWQYAGGEARITWPSGSVNVIRREGAGFQKLYYKSRKSLRGPPTDTGTAEKMGGDP